MEMPIFSYLLLLLIYFRAIAADINSVAIANMVGEKFGKSQVCQFLLIDDGSKSLEPINYHLNVASSGSVLINVSASQFDEGK